MLPPMCGSARVLNYSLGKHGEQGWVEAKATRPEQQNSMGTAKMRCGKTEGPGRVMVTSGYQPVPASKQGKHGVRAVVDGYTTETADFNGDGKTDIWQVGRTR